MSDEAPPTCSKCQSPINSDQSKCKLNDRAFHTNCFACGVCDKKLMGQQFYATDDNVYCEEHYLDSLEKCLICKQPIEDEILYANNEPHHPECYTNK